MNLIVKWNFGSYPNILLSTRLILVLCCKNSSLSSAKHFVISETCLKKICVLHRGRGGRRQFWKCSTHYLPEVGSLTSAFGMSWKRDEIVEASAVRNVRTVRNVTLAPLPSRGTRSWGITVSHPCSWSSLAVVTSLGNWRENFDEVCEGSRQ